MRCKSIKCTAGITFFLVLFWVTSAGSSVDYNFPSPRGFINDFSGVLSRSAVASLSGLCQDIKNKTGVEVSVVVIDSVSPFELEDYAVKLFEKWGIGEKNKDNGVLFILAAKDRKMRIEVGYGLEGILTDGYCGETLDMVIPYFKNGEYDQGVMTGVARIAAPIGKEYNIEFTPLPATSRNVLRKRGGGNPFQLFGIAIFVVISLLNRFLVSPAQRRKGKGYWMGGIGSGGFGGGGSFGGGGFGGFGGGMSGGGGSSRSW